MVLGNVTICNHVAVYNFSFAAILAFITSMSLGLLLASTTPQLLRAGIRDAVETGIMRDSLVHVLDDEQGIEAPLSLCLTSYAFAFSISGYWPLISGMASMGLSVYGVAVFAYEHADLEVVVASGSEAGSDSEVISA